MDEGEKILWNAVNQIAWGSEDEEPPFRAAPREVLIEIARKAIDSYRKLSSGINPTLSSGDEAVCGICGGDHFDFECPGK
jgi:hypothetical protein